MGQLLLLKLLLMVLDDSVHICSQALEALCTDTHADTHTHRATRHRRVLSQSAPNTQTQTDRQTAQSRCGRRRQPLLLSQAPSNESSPTTTGGYAPGAVNRKRAWNSVWHRQQPNNSSRGQEEHQEPGTRLDCLWLGLAYISYLRLCMLQIRAQIFQHHLCVVNELCLRAQHVKANLFLLGRERWRTAAARATEGTPLST